MSLSLPASPASAALLIDDTTTTDEDMDRHILKRCPMKSRLILIVAVIITLDRCSAVSPRDVLSTLRSLILSKSQWKQSLERRLTEKDGPGPIDDGISRDHPFPSTSLPILTRLRKWRTLRDSSVKTNAYTHQIMDSSSNTAAANTNSSRTLDLNDTSNVSLEVTESSPTKNTTQKKLGNFLLWRRDTTKTTRNEPLLEPKNETSGRQNETMASQEGLSCKFNQTEESLSVSPNVTQHMGPFPTATAMNTNTTATTGPSFIVVQRSPVPTRVAPTGYYKGGGVVIPVSPNPMPLHSPSPTTESGLVLVISALLPILSKLFLLMLLSGSSIFFGPSDLHPIYSPSPSQHFVLERVNDRYSRDDIAFQRAVRFPPANKSKRLWNILLNKRRRILKRSLESVSNHEIPPTPNHRNNSLYTRTVLIVDVHTEDIHNTVEYLRDAVSFILHQYHSNDSRLDLGTNLEIVFNVESPGGAVQDYGLAANQIARLRDSGKESGDLTVTVCVDKIAASGGYMIACQASPGQLLAAPLAIVGSIGVFRETLNIYDILTKYGIQPLLIKAGKAKVPLTQMNEVTKEGLAFVQKNVDTTHEVFKKMVLDQRGDVIDKKHVADVTSGDIYLGTNALALGLVDRLVTSDEYIAEKVRQGDRVLRLQKYDKSRAGMRFSPLDLLLSYKDGFLQSQLPWIRRFAPALLSLLKLGLSAGVVKALDLV